MFQRMCVASRFNLAHFFAIIGPIITIKSSIVYLSYFGLKEKPFSIAPNPEYLYMSERHKEALLHLNYGLGDTGGFVLLTGEVGTGKTTITRSMLKSLPDNTEVAFVLNPALSELELLASICDELNIAYDLNNATLKSLTDALKARFTDNYKAGGHTLLVIDEAQHLSPSVLEQLRLLTNLETDDKKLVQIALIGQPELQTLLQRNELRQLAQRITSRYHLLALTESQVFAYIQHRLQTAGCDASLFSHEAVALIYKRTQGIPRLINLLADRCLLGAFSAQKRVIDKTVVEQAAKEALPMVSLNNAPISESKLKKFAPVLSLIAASYLFGFAAAYIF